MRPGVDAAGQLRHERDFAEVLDERVEAVAEGDLNGIAEETGVSALAGNADHSRQMVADVSKLLYF